MDVYDLGDEVRVTATFTNDDEDLSDPSSITVRVLPPGGETVVYTYDPEGDPPGAVDRESEGVYTLTLEPAIPGRWVYRFETTGAVLVADERVFWVRATDLDLTAP